MANDGMGYEKEMLKKCPLEICPLSLGGGYMRKLEEMIPITFVIHW